MNKLAIPAMLTAVVMVVGALAILPVDNASAVHTTIATNINQQDRYINFIYGSGSVADTNVIIIPAKTGQTLQVAIAPSQVVDGVGAAITFEDTNGTLVASDSTIVTLAANFGLQIRDAPADTEYMVSITVAEDGP